MDLITDISIFLDRHHSVDLVLSSEKALSEMGSLLRRLNIDPNMACSGCVKGRFIYLQSLLTKKTTKMTGKIKGWPGKRWVLPDGKKIMPFGTGIYYGNADLTDEMVEAFDKKNPGFKSQFIDTHEGLEDAPAETPPVDTETIELAGVSLEMKKSAVEIADVGGTEAEQSSDPGPDEKVEHIDYEKKDPKRYFQYEEAYTHAQLLARHDELTGNKLPGRPTKRTLIFAIMKEEDALKELEN